MATQSRPTYFEPERCPVCGGWITGYRTERFGGFLGGDPYLLPAPRDIRLWPCDHAVESLTFRALTYFDLIIVHPFGLSNG